ncbi:hypothetical protein [Priestia megaterium]|nr:hypothetical protein [Priestia megaterium]
MDLEYKKNLQFKDRELKYKRKEPEEKIELIVFIVLISAIFIIKAFFKFL